jgi:hypothetical protein
MKKSISLFFILLIIVITSCKKKEAPCETINITYTKVDAALGQTNGSIKITNPRGNYLYSINNGSLQTDSVFSNLGIGTYTITAKNSTNCIGTATVVLPNPCTGVNVNLITTKVDAITGQANGSITITSPIGSGVTYTLNGGVPQSSANFNNLGVGTYALTAKTAAGCSGTGSATITGYGPKYYLVKNIIQGYCGPCHLNGGLSGNVNFDTDASITSKWDRIKVRAVDNLPSVMPQGGPLTLADKAKITDWVNAGHTVNN